ncbi:MAG: LysM peptidoglycan-binding domain-containing protein [Sulfurovum sp.]|nr:LysM peptidoglycan-binding domain-containing protein [Sulfurovum sp.]
MKKLHRFLISLAVASMATTYASAATHTIKKGETLSAIAKANKTTVSKLCKLNGLKQSDTLKVGKVLKVPGAQNTAYAVQTAQHKVKKGETLSAIAVANKTTIDQLCKLNGLKKNDTLKVGKVLKVPGTPNRVGVAETAEYKVKSGDALYAIAKKYKTDITTLKSLNGLQNNTLRAGQTIKVPAAERVKVAAKATKTSDRKLAQTLSSLPKSTYMKKEPSKKDVFNLGDIFFGKRTETEKEVEVIKVAKTKLGNRYVWGATGKQDTFDCSGFTKYCYKKNGIDIPRTSIMQSKYGKFVKRSELKKGDLIFFDTSRGRKGYVNHVGIYMGDNKFIHASSAKKKVVITSLDKTFYSQRYMGARRPL